MKTRRTTTALAAATALGLLLAGCSSTPSTTTSASTTSPTTTATSAPIVVFAAASLQSAFDELAADFEEKYPQYPVAPITYDGSQALATQIVDGADVDVIAFASTSNLEPVTEAGITDAGTVFATNTMQIAVAPGNPKKITDLADLADPDLAVVLCAVEVPCGAAAHTLLDDAGTTVKPVSEETSVSGVITRIENAEADAGLVYATDVAASAGKLEGITPSNASVAVNKYPIAVSTKAPSPEAAKAFVDYVLSDEGQALLAADGFGAP